jgi:hypothetical protein
VDYSKDDDLVWDESKKWYFNTKGASFHAAWKEKEMLKFGYYIKSDIPKT